MLPVMVPIPPELLVPVEVVSTKNCLRAFGIDPEDFRKACKADRIEGARRDGHTWYAPVASVRAWFATLATPTPRMPKSESTADLATAALERGPRARRVR